MICKRCDIGTAPLVCGLAIRTLPVSMFFIFKTIYQILSAIAQHFEVKSETSSAVGEQEEAERIGNSISPLFKGKPYPPPSQMKAHSVVSASILNAISRRAAVTASMPLVCPNGWRSNRFALCATRV